MSAWPCHGLWPTLIFHIVVLDDRAQVATMAANTYAQQKQVISYKNIGKHVSEGHQSYVVIMTFGHQGDERVLQQLAGKKLRYLGLMGSPAKIAQIIAHLKKKGIGAASLKKVHAPVGLPIHSHTPEEIAISIAAEIIQVKNS
jgi:xanthine dehydrogenase accessory factor